MIEVPYWWDRKLSSLASTIYDIRPDLFETKPKGNPIPLNPPLRDANEIIGYYLLCYYPN